MLCINKSHSDYKKLQENFPHSDSTLDAEIYRYQKRHNTDNIPTTLKELYDGKIPFETSKESAIVANNNLNRELNDYWASLISKYNADVFNIKNSNIDTNDNFVERLINLEKINTKVDKLTKLLNAEVILDTNLESAGMLKKHENGQKPIILINPDKAFSDTIEHEFSHLILELIPREENIFKEAVEFAKKQPQFEEVKSKYMELPTDEDIAKEVLADLMGKDMRSKLNNDIKKISTFSKILNNIAEFFSNLFGINSKTVVDKIVTQFLDGSLNMNPIEAYNNSIDRLQKFKRLDFVGEKKPQEIANRRLKEMSERLELNETNHTYTDKKTGEIYTTSGTKVIKEILGLEQDYSRYKGSYNKEFNADFFDMKNAKKILMSLDSIPISIHKAIENFFRGNYNGYSTLVEKPPILLTGTKSWFDVFNNHTLTERSDFMRYMEVVLKNKEFLKAQAEFIEQNETSVPARAGTYIHKAIEEYGVNNTKMPSNIENSELLKKHIDEIKKKSKEIGSTLHFEAKIFSNIMKIPATADIIEVLKDGSIRIYDFKTIDKAKDEFKLYSSTIANKYLPQQVGYGLILEEQGFKLANDNQYNVIVIENNRSNFAKEGKVKILSAKAYNYDIKNFNRFETSLYTSIHGPLMSAFTGSKLNLNSGLVLNKIGNLQTIIENQINSYNKTLGITYSRGADGEMKYKVNKNFHKFGKNMAKIITKYKEIQSKGESSMKLYIIENFLKEYMAAATIINNHHNFASADIVMDSDTIKFLTYFQQLGVSIQSIVELVRDIKNDKIFLKSIKEGEFKSITKKPIDFEALDKTISEVQDNYFRFNNTFQNKRKQAIINFLVTHSRRGEGVYLEKLDVKLNAEEKELGRKYTKEERNKLIHDEISKPEIKQKIFDSEKEYWLKELNEGMLDLGWFDAWLIDPGANKSQAVQIIKGVIDGANMNVQHYLNENVTKIVKAEKNLKIKGNTETAYRPILDNLEVLDSNNETIDTEVKEYYKTNSLQNYLITEEISQFQDEMKLKDLHFQFFNKKIGELSYKKGRLIHPNEKIKIKELLEKAEKAEKDNTIQLTKKEQEYINLHKEQEKYINKSKDFSAKNKKILEERTAKWNEMDWKKYYKKKANPQYTKLNLKHKAVLDFALKSIRTEENQIAHLIPKQSSLVQKYSPYAVHLVENHKDYTIDIVKLPLSVRSSSENALNLGQTISDTYKKTIKDVFETSGEFRNFDYTMDFAKTDLLGNEIMDIPLFMRKPLADSNTMSLDVFTLLSNHMLSVQQYKNHRNIENDLTMILDGIREVPIKKKNLLTNTSSQSSNMINMNVNEQSNVIAKTISNQIKNTLYQKQYDIINSVGAQRAANISTKAKSLANRTYMLLNYTSALTTAAQGTIYTALEAAAGVYLNKGDLKIGMNKAVKDIPNMVTDSYKAYPESKSILLLRLLGLDPHNSTALTNVFAKDNTLKKVMSLNTGYIFTGTAENYVASQLMYAILNNIKVMDINHEYISKDGKTRVKDAKDAMTLDEAYSINKNGSLELHKDVMFTNKSYTSKIVSDEVGLQTQELINIKREISSIYKDLNGQYDNKLKSNAEMTLLGSHLMSLKQYLPRGLHNRFRGLQSSVFTNFDARRAGEGNDVRFFSQDLGKFKEGYVTTTIAMLRNIAVEVKNLHSLGEAYRLVRHNMTTDEKANVKRTCYEVAILIATMLSSIAAGRFLFNQLDDNDDKERIAFGAFMVKKLNNELTTFYDPMRISREFLNNPSPTFTYVNTAIMAMMQTFGIKINEGKNSDFLSLNILDTYNSGTRKGEYKMPHAWTKLVPGFSKTNKIINIITNKKNKWSGSFHDAVKASISNRFMN